MKNFYLAICCSIFFISCKTTDKGLGFPEPIDQLIQENLKDYLRLNKLHKIELDGIEPETHFPEMIIGNSGETLLAEPASFIVHRDSLLIVDRKNHHIAVSHVGSPIITRTIGENGQAPGEFSQPLTICENGQNVFIEDQHNDRIQVFSNDLKYVDSLPIASSVSGRAICSEKFVFVTKQSTDRKFLLQGFEAKTPFKKAINILPYLSSEKDRLRTLNYAISAEVNQEIVAAYRTLPFVFMFDKNGTFTQSLVLESSKISTHVNKNNEAAISMQKDNREPVLLFMNAIGKTDKGTLAIALSNKIVVLKLKKKKWKLEKIIQLFRNEDKPLSDYKNWIGIQHFVLFKNKLYVLPNTTDNDPVIYSFNLKL